MASQMLLPGYEKTEADMVAEAMALPLEAKIQTAIDTLRAYEPMALSLNPAGFWLAFSGGKDSCVMLELAKMAGVKYHAAYSVTTIDPPELVRFIKREHPDVEWVRQPISFFARLARRSNGPPTRLARWCCEEFKEGGGRGWMKLIGIRVAESSRRAKLWRTYVPNRRGGGIVCPICYWTDEDVWQFIRQRMLPYCELYDQGFARLGCVGCPMGGPNSVAREFDRWPRYRALWKRAIVRFWERWHDVPRNDGKPRYSAAFASGDAMWEWWLSGARRDDGLQCQGEFLFADDNEDDAAPARKGDE
jgi:phosphoadenosine phosphosulfate reductase